LPNVHKRTPRSVRLPEADESWLLQHATGAVTVNALIVQAVQEYRARVEQAANGATANPDTANASAMTVNALAEYRQRLQNSESANAPSANARNRNAEGVDAAH